MAKSTASLRKRREFFMGWQQGRCYLNGCAMTYVAGQIPRNSDATDDHVLPKSKKHSRLFNSALACSRCNEARGNLPPSACMLLFAHEAWAAFYAATLSAPCSVVPLRPVYAGCAPRIVHNHPRGMRGGLWVSVPRAAVPADGWVPGRMVSEIMVAATTVKPLPTALEVAFTEARERMAKSGNTRAKRMQRAVDAHFQGGRP